MARGANQKLKILYVAKILNTTDEEHPITCEEILRYLEANGIEAERKTVYSDIEALQNGHCFAARQRVFSGIPHL